MTHRTLVILFVSIFVLVVGGVVFALSMPSISLRPVVYGDVASTSAKESIAQENALVLVVEKTQEKMTLEHVALPPAVKAIYMSQCYASMPKLRAKLIKIANDTEVNSIIVDIKDYTGTVAFTPAGSVVVQTGDGCKVRDMRELVAEMHAQGIYVIGRITVFQDPNMVTQHPEWAVKRVSDPTKNWADRKGLGFIDVGARPYWDYMVALSRESHDVGFDELNYDYVRYPSDGNMKDALYTHSVNKAGESTNKAEHLEKFFAYLTSEVRKPYDSKYSHVVNSGQSTVNGAGTAGQVPHIPVLSADLFGMTATNTDDLTIGQVLERALPYFDFVAPMVYPSHYPSGFNGYKDPNKNAYGVIKYSMDVAVARAKATETDVEGLLHVPVMETVEKEVTNEKVEVVKIKEEIKKVRNGKQIYTKPNYNPHKLRTWIQDFDYGGDYGPAEVREQFKATYDAGLTSWMIWNASNRYTVGALKK
jgi:hypothetical protein